MGHPFDLHHFDYAPWEFPSSADGPQRARQLAAQGEFLAQHPDSRLGQDVYLSSLACIQTDLLHLGDRSYVAAHAHLSGEVRFGADCSVNVQTVVRGRVTGGDGVRIGGQTSILGFNHRFAPDEPVFRQGLSSRGITIGDDVWIGSHAVLLDGIVVGQGAVIGAGSVVTKDVPAGAVVAGNPARFIRWRRDPGGPREEPLAETLRAFGEAAREAIPGLLADCWNEEARLFGDQPGRPPSLRAQCDAIELADLAGLECPPQRSLPEWRDLLRGTQEPATGLPLPFERPGLVADLYDGEVNYHLLTVGYALDLLGDRLPRPVQALASYRPQRLAGELAGLPWDTEAWACGHLLDAIGTGLRWNLAAGGEAAGQAEELLGALFAWLDANADPLSGAWGRPGAGGDLLQLVNGAYRATRGTYAQFDRPLPHPRALIDAVLRHGEDPEYFAAGRLNACNVLDVVHPLWLAGRQTSHRQAEITATARRLLALALEMWQQTGFGFAQPGADRGAGPGSTPGLQGTEMWLSVIWYLADLLGHAAALGYRPRGVHSPDPFCPPGVEHHGDGV
ncbi:MAG: acyltransferase [Promicromonosporaceae bacterium]|nr:acyltransferase [Promicromonosporaceae bacterium]